MVAAPRGVCGALDPGGRPVMRRRSTLYLVAILGLFFASAGTVVAMLVRHVPTYYRQNELPGAVRECRYAECDRLTLAVWNTIENGLPWRAEFKQDQLNGYLQHECSHSSAGLVELPDDVHDIRVALDADRIRLGFRYGQGWASAVISVELRVWLVAKETNVIALELCGFHAGAMPLGTQVLLDFIAEAARKHNIEVTWFRHRNHPVALLHFQANQPRPTILFTQLEIQPGQLVIAGSPPPDAAQAPPAAP
jgi:hypothetical protein